MGIYDREYYRGETQGSAWFSGVSPICNALIAINVAIFLFQQLAKLPPEGEVISTYFAASVEQTFHNYKLWQLLTAAFFHGNPWHLLFNMWFFWIVAREMEPLYGSRDFLAFYLSAAIFSTLIWLIFAALSGQTLPMIGASGAVTATATLFTLYYPTREMIFIIFRLPMWLLLAIILIHDLIPVLSGVATPVAVEAHLAGAGFAFLFKQFDLRWSRLIQGRLSRPRLRIFTPPPREPSRSRSSSPSRSAASIGSVPRAPPFPCSPRSNSTHAWTKCSPRSPARAAPASPRKSSGCSRKPAAAHASSGATGRECPPTA